MKQLAEKHHAWIVAMGWNNKTPLEQIALIASEIGEAANECRGEKPTEHLGEELADIILRTMSLAEDQGIDIEAKMVEKMKKNFIKGTKGRLK